MIPSDSIPGHLTLWLVAAGVLPRVPLARLPLTEGHREAWLLWCLERVDWRVEWRSVVFSDENRFSLYVSDECTREQRSADLVSVIFRSAFAHLRLHGVEGVSYNSRSHLVFLQS